jgi:hypothetical protein
MKNEEEKKMEKSIVLVVLALFLTLCVGILYITPAANALTYGLWSDLGSVSGVGGFGTTTNGIYSLIYAGNHEVYGYVCSPITGTHLFSVNLDSNRGYYPLTMAAAVTDLGAPLSGAQFTYPVGPLEMVGGNALTFGYASLAQVSVIFGGGHAPGSRADLIVYDIDTGTWADFGRPSCLPSHGYPQNEAIFALATGLNGTIYGGTGYYPNPPNTANPDLQTSPISLLIPPPRIHLRSCLMSTRSRLSLTIIISPQ